MYERIEKLCKEKGTSPTKLCTELTGSSGNLPTWKKGNIKPSYVVKIADYFGVSADYLLGRTDIPLVSENFTNGNNSIQAVGDNLNINSKTEIESEISNILSELTPREKTELMMIIYNFYDEHKNKK